MHIPPHFKHNFHVFPYGSGIVSPNGSCNLAIEEAKGYQRLMDQFDQSADDVAKSIGKSRSYVANMTRLLGLPNSVQVMVMQNELSAGHARALLKAPNPTLLAQEVVQKNLSVRETEKLAAQSEGRDIQSRKDKNAAKVRTDKDADTLALEREMSNLLGMDVVLTMKDAQKGVLSVEFRDLDQLDNLLQRLSQTPQRANMDEV